MKEICIRKYTSFETLSDFKKVIDPCWVLKEAIVNAYTILRSIPTHDTAPEYWPFKAIFKDPCTGEEIRVYVYYVSIGCANSDADDFSKILDFLKIVYNADDIFSNKSKGEDGYIRLHYTR